MFETNEKIQKIEKGTLKIRLLQRDLDVINSGDIVIYDRDWFPFKIQIENWAAKLPGEKDV